jgi:hypothetical protein
MAGWRYKLMSSDLVTLAALGVGVLVIGLFAYAGYLGLRARAVLLDSLYKARASWVSSVAVLFVFLISSNLVIGTLAPDNWYLSLLLFLVEYAAAIVTFAWVDATIKVARRSDPLQRDTLHWRTFRKILWVVVVFSVAGGVASVVYFMTNFFSSPGGPEGALLYGPFGNFFALIALVLSRSRSKDFTLRRHMKWFSLFMIVTLVSTQSELLKVPDFRVISGVFLLAAGFFILLAARSLVPVNVKIEQVHSKAGAALP